MLSSTLFKIYSVDILADALTNLELGIRINAKYINNLRYANSTVMLAVSFRVLQLLMDRSRTKSEKFGLDLIIRNTKFMVIKLVNSGPGSLLTRNEEIEKFDRFVYLGTTINWQWDYAEEIRSRVEITRSRFIRVRPLLYSKDLTPGTKMWIVRC